MKTIQIMPAAEAAQFCATDNETSFFSGRNNPVTALSIGGGSPRLMKRRGMLIISRLPRTTHAEDSWLAAVRKVVDDLIRNDYVIVTSVGSVGWDYITWYAAKKRASLWIIFPPEGTDKLKQMSDKVVQDLQIPDKSATFFMPIVNENLQNYERLWIRDNTVYTYAHVHHLICRRSNSGWDALTNNFDKVNCSNEVEYPRKHRQKWIKLLKADKDYQLNFDDNTNYLTHWTRGTYGPWKGNSKDQYFSELSKFESGNPRDGYQTLCHIIRTKLLRGSGSLIRGGEPVISFSEAGIEKVFKLIRYRTSLGHWNFEPYGIGFPQDLLKSIGAKSVSYGDDKTFENLSDDEKPYFQFNPDNDDTKKSYHNWTIEGEWRLLGDLDFESIIQEAIFIVPTKEEAENIYQEIGINLKLKHDNIRYLLELSHK